MTTTTLRPYQPPEGGGVVVDIRRDGERLVITRTVPNGADVVGVTYEQDTALVLLIRAYGDGVTTRRLVEHVGAAWVRAHLTRLREAGKVGRTRTGGWVEGGSRLGVEGMVGKKGGRNG